MVTSDWGALGATFDGGMSYSSFFAWGTETWTNAERVAAYVAAGGHQIGTFAGGSIQFQDAFDAGAITEEEIANAAQKVLEVSFKVGAFENPYVDETQAVSAQEALEDEAHDAMMRAFTLLKNDEDILPLDASSADQNATAGIQVFFDGHDDAAILEYAGAAGFDVVEDIADADYAVIRVSGREGVYTGLDGGVPLSYRDPVKVYDQDTNMVTDVDSTASGAFGGSAEESNAAGNAVADTIEGHIAAKGADTKLIFVVSTVRAWIWSDYIDDTDVLAAEFGMTDEALLDMIFQMRNGTQDTSIQPTGTLPLELPSSQDAAYASDEDVPNDSADPLFDVGAGILSY